VSFIKAMAAIENIARSADTSSRPKVTIDFDKEIDRARFRAAVRNELMSMTFATNDRKPDGYERMKGTVHGVDVDIP